MNSQTQPRVAIIGSGISGLTAAYRLQKDVELTVFEKNDWIGGHTHTVDVTLDSQTYAVDTGFDRSKIMGSGQNEPTGMLGRVSSWIRENF